MRTLFSLQNLRFFPALVCVLAIIVSTEPVRLLLDFGGFTFLGVVGAIFANSTGAGGGVIFVPFFNQLAFTPETTVATSFAIQCCGMTAGAITWLMFYRQHCRQNSDWNELRSGLMLTVPFSISGIGLAQFHQALTGGITDASALHAGFGIFSIFLALTIFATIPILKKETYESYFSSYDKVCLPMVSLAGGGITAWLSVGVGELVAVYLIIRGFNVTFSIAIAVVLSAFSVWGGALYHVIVTDAVHWQVVLFAGTGAVIGGVLAKYLTLYFSATRLKVFFAVWILLLGIASLPYS